MKNYETITGPCSKWVDGKGWQTNVDVHILNSLGYYKNNVSNSDLLKNVCGLIAVLDFETDDKSYDKGFFDACNTILHRVKHIAKVHNIDIGDYNE